MRINPVLLLATMSLALPGAIAQPSSKPNAYPAQQQDAQQQGQDDAQCLDWARQQTGIDPAVVAATPVQATGPQGERMRGALRGAAGGAVIGEVVNDDAGQGAAVGATAGVLAGGARARRNQALRAQQAAAAGTQSLDAFYQAYGACMEGRGYTVK